MNEFWVIGGAYKDTRFDELKHGVSEERYGPYWSYRDAERAWQRLSWREVDNCQVRYQIIEEAVFH